MLCLEGTVTQTQLSSEVEGASGFGAASGPGNLTDIEGTMNAELYHEILQENVTAHRDHQRLLVVSLRACTEEVTASQASLTPHSGVAEMAR